VVTDNHSFIIVYIHTVSPIGEQFFRLAHTLIRILQYLLSNPLLSICLPFNHSLKLLYLSYFYYVYFFRDSKKSLRTFAVIIESSLNSHQTSIAVPPPFAALESRNIIVLLSIRSELTIEYVLKDHRMVWNETQSFQSKPNVKEFIRSAEILICMKALTTTIKILVYIFLPPNTLLEVWR